MKCFYLKICLYVLTGIIVFPLGSRLTAEPFKSAIRSDSFNLEGALQRAAIRFFPPQQAGAPYFVKMEKRFELHSEGVEYELYSVLRNFSAVGRFVRYRVFSDKTSRFDLALKVQNGIIEVVEPLRISVIEGKPFLHEKKLFSVFQGVKVEDFSLVLAQLFESFLYLDEISRNRTPSGPRLSDEAGKKFSQALFDSLPKPVDTLLKRSVSLIGGQKVSMANSRGTLIIWGSLTDDYSLRLVEAAKKHLGQWKGTVLYVFTDHTDEMSAFIEQGGRVPDSTILDWEEDLKEAFSVPVVPYVTGYDGKGTLILSSLFYDETKLSDQLSIYKREAIK